MSKSTPISFKQQQSRLTLNQLTFNNKHQLTKMAPTAQTVINTLPLPMTAYKGL